MAYEHPEYLVSPQELADDLSNPRRRVFDATVFLTPTPPVGYQIDSGRAKFEEGHVPGALGPTTKGASVRRPGSTTTAKSWCTAPVT